MKQPCPSCPDGNEWDRNGPTGKACSACGGNVECVNPIDRMGLTVFLRAKLNAVHNAALEEAKEACASGPPFQRAKNGGHYTSTPLDCVLAIDALTSHERSRDGS